MDGFSAHEDPQFIRYSAMLDIIPYQLPSHTIHLLQPLDLGVYQHLKRAQRSALYDFIGGCGLQLSRFQFQGMRNRL